MFTFFSLISEFSLIMWLHLKLRVTLFFSYKVAAETGAEGTEAIAKPVVAEETGGVKHD